MKSKPLIFLDTTILLNFYRSRRDAGGLKLLKRLDEIRRDLILTYQVAMEFKKNRQTEILQWMTELNCGGTHREITSVTFLEGSKQVEAINKQFREANKCIREAKKRIEELKADLNQCLREPLKHDTVYRRLHAILQNKSQFNLTWESPHRPQIQRRARRRFLQGFPPRKSKDTSMGDAVNWEWILHCAVGAQRDVLIVSNDGDYGTTLNERSYINDWLRDEFRETIGRGREVVLFDRLSNALKAMNVRVTDAEESEEARALELQKSRDVLSYAIVVRFPDKFDESRLKQFTDWLNSRCGVRHLWWQGL